MWLSVTFEGCFDRGDDAVLARFIVRPLTLREYEVWVGLQAGNVREPWLPSHYSRQFPVQRNAKLDEADRFGCAVINLCWCGW